VSRGDDNLQVYLQLCTRRTNYHHDPRRSLLDGPRTYKPFYTMYYNIIAMLLSLPTTIVQHLKYTCTRLRYNTTGLYPCTGRLSESISVYVINTRCGEFFLRCDLNNFSYIRLYYTHTNTYLRLSTCIYACPLVYVCIGIV